MDKTRDRQNIHFFTGKGGVGKSVVAASKAMSLAASGGRVLLVELEGSQSLEEMLSKKPKKFDWVCLRPIDELKGLFNYFFKIKKITELFFGNKAMNSLVQAAPGLKELASLGKLTSYNRKFGPSYDYDHVVVDAYSTGHFINWLSVPVGMSEVIRRGPMGEQCLGIVESLKDKDSVTYYAVVNSEEAPKEEALFLFKEIKKLTKIKPIIILNKVVNEASGKQVRSGYVLHQIKETKKLIKDFNDYENVKMPYSFHSSSYEQALELSGLWR